MKVRLPKTPGMGNPQALMQQMQKMQEDMANLQADLDAREYEIKAGGGAVAVKINGKKEVLSIDIAPEIVDPDDIETLTDVLTAAFNEAIKKVEDTTATEMEAITGGMPGLGGMGGFPGFGF